MRHVVQYTIVAVVFLLTLNSFSVVVADKDERKEPNRPQEGSVKEAGQKHNRSGETSLKPVMDPAYKETCGACHFAYQPELLPSGSWGKILANINEHFGEGIDMDAESRRIIGKYLMDNSADRSSAKLAIKIMQSLKGQTPSRITEIPYIRHKHHEIPREVFAREAIGSFSHCSACHKAANQGKYDDDDVTIPE